MITQLAHMDSYDKTMTLETCNIKKVWRSTPFTQAYLNNFNAILHKKAIVIFFLMP
jgi:hypothetical protein